MQVQVWPLLDDAQGRWLSGWTSDDYAIHLEAVLREIRATDRTYSVIFDLEPPIAWVRQALQRRLSSAWMGRFSMLADHASTRAQVETLIDMVRADGHRVSAVVPPFVLWDEGDFVGIQKSLGTPVTGLDFDRVWVMAYTSLLEGYGRGLIRRQDARSLLARWSVQARSRFGPKAGVALGVVGGGALGDERPYRSIVELRDDVAIVSNAGIDHVALFGLSGVLTREPFDPWFAALCEPKLVQAPPDATRRTRILAQLGRSFSRLA